MYFLQRYLMYSNSKVAVLSFTFLYTRLTDGKNDEMKMETCD